MNIASATPMPASNVRAFGGWLRAKVRMADIPRPATALRRTVHELAREETLAVAQPHGAEIECLDGSVWVTLDSDPRDVILESGQRFRVDSHRRTLIHALDAARVRIVAPA